MIVPIPISWAVAFIDNNFIFFVKNEIINKNNIEKNIRYQTSKDSFNVINFPKTPVNPAKNIAVCNWRKAFFSNG